MKNQSIQSKDMHVFIRRFSKAAGAPASSGLHIHPSQVNGGSSEGLNVQRISSEAQMKAGGAFWRGDKREFWGSHGWHSE